MESSQIREKEENQNENSKNEEELEQKKIETIFSGCAELTPLIFVDTIERLYHTLFNKTKFGSLNTLSSYKKSNIRKIDLIEFELKSQNSSKLLRKMNDINCIKIAGDKLYTGDKSGIVYMYQIDKGLELEGFGVTGFNSPVTVIENKGNEYLLVGYENGTINLFDVKKNMLIKSINDIHKTKILALKFVSIEKNSFQVISSDEEGQVMFINSSNTMLNKKTVRTIIFKEDEPTYAITKFKPFEENKLTFLAFALTNKVHIYTLEPRLNSIFEIKKPKYAEKNDIPDISLGWGIRPIQENSKKKVEIKKRDKEILLAVGWGNIISLYGFQNKGDNYRIEGPIGFYQNNYPLIRVGFFSISIIYFFDKNSQIKALNTAFFNYGKYEDNKLNANNNALIDEGEKFKNMKFNNISSIKEKEYKYYRNFIYNMKKSIYLLTNEGLRIGKILNYKDCINNIRNGNNWISALCLAIDIYKGNYNNFMGVPLDKEERKKLLYPYLIHLLNLYIDYNFNVDNESNSDIELLSSSSTPDNNISEIKDEKIMECINVSIEFCIEINSVDYLLKDVERTFARSGKSDLFYKFFEPFIFSDLLIKEDIGIDALTSLYSAYKMKDELVLLSHLYTHLKLICLNNFALKKLAVKEKLFDLITFIFANGNCCEDFFFPITKMFNAYSKEVQKENAKKEVEKNNENELKYFSYYDLYLKKGINGINKMEKSKEFICHKLLWYIEMCLKGKKFAPATEIELFNFQYGSNEYKKFVSYIYFWILQEQIFKALLEFDSYSLFLVLIPFFIEPKIIKIIKNFDFSTINVDSLQKLIKEQEDGIYLMREMKNSLIKVTTMVQPEKTDENKAKNELKSSLTIMPGKTNIEPSLKEEEKLEIIKEEEDKKEENQNEAPKGDEKENLKENNEKENPKEDKEKKKEKLENIDPFASSKGGTQFGLGVKLNDLNSILEYIIKIVESQPSDLSHLDLDAFLIKYAAKSTESIPPKIREKILKGFENLLNFFSENKRMRKDLIAQHQDRFNIHNFSKKQLDPEDSYFLYASNLLNELLNSKLYQFTQDELYNLKSAASGTKFTKIKIKIEELSKRYNECLDIFIKQENQKKKEEIFPWMEEKFQYFIDEINEEKKKDIEKEEKNNDSRINLLKKDFNSFQDAIIDKVYELTKIKLDKTKRILGKYFSNTEKYKVYLKLEKDPEIQYEFLYQLLYQIYDKIEEENLAENSYDEPQNKINDLFKVYKDNKNENDKNIEEKKMREEFDKLLLNQIHLLIVLKRKPEIKNLLEKNIKGYPNYPMREALKECVENNITDSAVFIFQSLGENRSALNLTKQNLEESFKLYINNPSNNEDFNKKLEVCTKICKDNSESLMKKENKEQNKEGEELWFDLLKRLYEFEDELEKKNIEENNKKLIQNTLQKAIEDLLKQMCENVTIQNLVGYVTDKQERAQYKEFKSILESMLRSNTSFDRVLNSVIAILKDSIENSESKRKKVTSRGHNYFYKKCDVCNKFYVNSKAEIIYCFGCGHQSHEKCCHRKYLKNENENRIILNNEEEEENYIPECEVCRKNKIENKNKWVDEDENIKNVQDVIEEDTEQTKVNAPSDKAKTFKFGNKKDKLKKIERYDKSYQNEVSMFY